MSATDDTLDLVGQEIDDSILTQVAETYENLGETGFDINDITLSQALDSYEVNNGDVKIESTGENAQTNGDVKIEENAVTDDHTRPEKNGRFGPATSQTDFSTVQSENENKNTKKNTAWAIRIWQEWAQLCEIPNILSLTAANLDYFLCRFILEARRKDGDHYPPRTLYMISCGILRYLRDNGVTDLNFLDEKDERFIQFRKTLDGRMKQLHADGKGTTRRQAEPITPGKEEALWTSGELGDHSADALLNTVFYYNTKLFGLRAIDEHRNLQCEQFNVGTDTRGVYVEFNGRSTKTLKGGIKQRNVEAKSIRHYSSMPESDRCVFKLYSKYLDLIGNSGDFYRRPLSGLRYSRQVVGVNKLSTLIKSMCNKAGLTGFFTNHSGKRTCATTLFNNGVDEQLICERTGHRSNAVRAYKRPSPDQQVQISGLLDPPKPDGTLPPPDKRRAEDASHQRSDLMSGKSVMPMFSNCNVTINITK